MRSCNESPVPRQPPLGIKPFCLGLMDIARRVLNVVTALLILIMGRLLVSIFNANGFADFGLPISFFGVLFGVPAAAHLIAFALAWSNRKERSNPSRAVLGLPLSSISLFVWALLCTAIVEADHRGLLASRGIHFFALMGGTVIALVSAAFNVAYFRATLIGRPHHSSTDPRWPKG